MHCKLQIVFGITFLSIMMTAGIAFADILAIPPNNCEDCWETCYRCADKTLGNGRMCDGCRKLKCDYNKKCDELSATCKECFDYYDCTAMQWGQKYKQKNNNMSADEKYQWSCNFLDFYNCNYDEMCKQLHKDEPAKGVQQPPQNVDKIGGLNTNTDDDYDDKPLPEPELKDTADNAVAVQPVPVEDTAPVADHVEPAVADEVAPAATENKKGSCSATLINGGASLFGMLLALVTMLGVFVIRRGK